MHCQAAASEETQRNIVIHFFGTIKMFEMLCFINYINILKTLKHIL